MLKRATNLLSIILLLTTTTKGQWAYASSMEFRLVKHRLSKANFTETTMNWRSSMLAARVYQWRRSLKKWLLYREGWLLTASRHQPDAQTRCITPSNWFLRQANFWITNMQKWHATNGLKRPANPRFLRGLCKHNRLSKSRFQRGLRSPRKRLTRFLTQLGKIRWSQWLRNPRLSSLSPKLLRLWSHQVQPRVQPEWSQKRKLITTKIIWIDLKVMHYSKTKDRTLSSPLSRQSREQTFLRAPRVNVISSVPSCNTIKRKSSNCANNTIGLRLSINGPDLISTTATMNLA